MGGVQFIAMQTAMDYDRVLRQIEKGLEDESAGPTSAQPRRRASVLRFALLLPMKLLLLIVLPFLLLVHSSVYVHRHYAANEWLALSVGALLTAALLAIYALWISRRLTGRIRFSRTTAKIILAVVAFYCCYSLLYLSGVNVKTREIKPYYTSLHPLLRTAVSTIILADADLIITDMQREEEDYVSMGLPIRERSMHYEQKDGYVHAVDLRTIDRAEWRNKLVETYFLLTGFRTVRHVGTEDHLHVELPSY